MTRNRWALRTLADILELLDGVGLTEKKSIPKKGGVYFIFETYKTVQPELKYIGFSRNIKKRVYEQATNLNLHEKAKNIEVFWFLTNNPLDENFFIRKFQPKVNINGKRKKQKMLYVRDENLLAANELKNFSGFVNWCVSQKPLREEFNNKVKK